MQVASTIRRRHKGVRHQRMCRKYGRVQMVDALISDVSYPISSFMMYSSLHALLGTGSIARSW